MVSVARHSMKWFTHKAVAVAGALAAGAHAGALVAVLVGSVLPDMIDTAAAHGNKRVWRRIHRQTSHWFGWYVAMILLGVVLPLQEMTADFLRMADISFPGISRRALSEVLGNDLLVWLGLGGLVHVLLDALTPMRVPLFPWGGSRRFGVSLVSTGSWQEHAFLVVAVGAIALQFEKARQVLGTVLHGLF